MLPATLLTASRQRRVNHDSRSEAAYRIIKEKIVTLALPPASLLNEAELMAELGLGRTPVREALQRLALENLVIILPRRGTIVADLNMSDLQKIFEMRLELEVYTVRLAAERATPAQVAEMEALLANSDEIIRQGDYYQLMRLDHQAHQLLAQAAHNEFLAETLERLYTHGLRLWYISLHKVSRLSEAIAEHRDIIAAIKAGDGQRAAEIMRTHITDFQTQLTAAL
ncbi:MAG: GntR family transcriptional regulator [Anaerolineae bacterium]|nr:GntR family transcriptional regulator [Anaerolineales bacterium]MCQ3974187.1 GntR family transcriptional regulator [Anaerolineae bacterium]